LVLAVLVALVVLVQLEMGLLGPMAVCLVLVQCICWLVVVVAVRAAELVPQKDSMCRMTLAQTPFRVVAVLPLLALLAVVVEKIGSAVAAVAAVPRLVVLFMLAVRAGHQKQIYR